MVAPGKTAGAGPTPQQQRKKYWEDKCADLRDFHDDLRDASDK
jgi:hypothetical protein